MMSTLVSMLSQRAASAAGNKGFRFITRSDEEGEQLSFRQVDHRARQIGAHLQARFEPGKSVLLLLPPGLDYVVAFFGCLYGGMVPIPAYPIRRNRSSDRLVMIAQHAKPALVISSRAGTEKSKDASSNTRILEGMPWLDIEDITTSADAWSDPAASPSDPACIQYTSGSTSNPRGVVLTHANILHNAATVYARCHHSEDSQGVIWLPPYHDMGLFSGIVQPVFAGFPIVLMPPASFLWNPMLWLQAITKYRGTTSAGPNFAYDLCVRKVQPRELATLDLSSWSSAVCGAEPVHAEVLERFNRTFAPVNFRASALNACYGLAEATLYVSGPNTLRGSRIVPFDREALERNRAIESSGQTNTVVRLVGCGEPADGQRVLIVDPHELKPVDDGAVGEIWLQGDNLAARYLSDEDATRTLLNAHLANGDGPYTRTGDLGFFHDDELFVTGRIKDMMIIAGRNIYPQDIEQTVEASQSVFEPGAVVAFELSGGATGALGIVAELKKPLEPAHKNEIELAVKAAVLAEHDLSIQKLVFLRKGELPKTSSGKKMRQQMREITMRKIEALQTYNMFVGEWEPIEAGVSQGKLSDGIVWIFADASGAAHEIVPHLVSTGVRCVWLSRDGTAGAASGLDVHEVAHDAHDLSVFDARIKELAQTHPPSSIVFAWGIDSVTAPGEVDAVLWVDLSNTFLTMIKSIIRHVSGRLPSIRVLTRNAEQVGDENQRLMSAWQAALQAIGSTAAIEYPDVVCRSIDLDNAAVGFERNQNNERAAELILAGGSEERVAIRSGMAFGWRLQEIGKGKVPAPRLDTSLKLKPGATYVLSGGLGELGLRLAADMVARGARRLVLIGRTPPTGDRLAKIEALRAQGVAIVFEQADVGQKEQLAGVFERLAERGAVVAGVVHMAGDFDDTPIIELGPEILRPVLAGRSIGAWNLHQATERADLDFFIAFSSSVAVLGAPGQAAYAASNMVLDALCQWRFANGLPALSVNWGPWATDEDVGRDLIRSIAPAQGFYLLWHLAAEPLAQVTVLPFDVRHMLSFFPNAGERSAFKALIDDAEIVNKKYGRGPKPIVTARTETERVVSSVIKQALALEEVSMDDGFFELGGDSVVAGGVINRISAIFGVDIGLEDAIEAMNVAALAALVDRLIEEQTETS